MHCFWPLLGSSDLGRVPDKHTCLEVARCLLELLQWCDIHAEHPGLCRVLRSFLLLREHHTPTCFLLHSQFAPCLHMFEMSPPVMLSRPSPAQLTEEDAGDRCHTAAYLAEHMWDTHSALLLSICTRTRAWKKESTNMRTLSGAVCAFMIMCACVCALESFELWT